MATSLGGEVSFEFPPEGVRWALAIDAAHIVRSTVTTATYDVRNL
jgi:hypothetical protein